jgi:protein-tyrosine phosphatase
MGEGKLKDRGMFWITACIAQGGYPDEADFQHLREAGITHLFNVDLPYLDSDSLKQMGFSDVLWKPIIDGRRIPDNDALACLDALHGAVQNPDSRVYIHCHAGIQRSPTILWLYFVACGMTPDEARDLIIRSSKQAIAGHPALCDVALVKLIQEHGKKNYLPHKRPQALLPF